jgi:hypothetical protein
LSQRLIQTISYLPISENYQANINSSQYKKEKKLFFLLKSLRQDGGERNNL